MRGGKPMKINEAGFWTMPAKDIFDGMSNVTVKLPEGVACMLIIRSTLNRNGIFLTSGLYDSGFEGPIGFTLRNDSGVAFIKRGTRVGQIMFMSSDSAGLYSGGYNRKAGEHWNESIGGEKSE